MPLVIPPNFISHASAQGARSTALHALQWVLGLLLSALPFLVWAGAPLWILVTAMSAIVVVLLVFLVTYVYLLFRNPDALRSENFTLSKLAMDKGLLGDTTSGFYDPQRTPSGSSNALTLPTDQGRPE